MFGLFLRIFRAGWDPVQQPLYSSNEKTEAQKAKQPLQKHKASKWPKQSVSAPSKHQAGSAAVHIYSCYFYPYNTPIYNFIS